MPWSLLRSLVVILISFMSLPTLADVNSGTGKQVTTKSFEQLENELGASPYTLLLSKASADELSRENAVYFELLGRNRDKVVSVKEVFDRVKQQDLAAVTEPAEPGNFMKRICAILSRVSGADKAATMRAIELERQENVKNFNATTPGYSKDCQRAVERVLDKNQKQTASLQVGSPASAD